MRGIKGTRGIIGTRNMTDGTRDTKVMRGMGCMRGDTRSTRGMRGGTQCIRYMVYRVHGAYGRCMAHKMNFQNVQIYSKLHGISELYTDCSCTAVHKISLILFLIIILITACIHILWEGNDFSHIRLSVCLFTGGEIPSEQV